MKDTGALTFGDFVTKSGRNTPYFVNTGKYNHGEDIAQLGKYYANCILDNSDIIDRVGNTVLFGPAYKGIPLVVATSIALAEQGINVKYCFNRKEAKNHGEGGEIVGHKLSPYDNVIIIEDVITAGTAVREVMPLLKSAGAIVKSLVISVDRMERGTGGQTAIQEIEEEFGINTYPIVNVEEILDSLDDQNLIAQMQAYMQKYCNL